MFLLDVVCCALASVFIVRRLLARTNAKNVLAFALAMTVRLFRLGIPFGPALAFFAHVLRACVDCA